MYATINFERLLGLPGFSDNALTFHFTLYQGYVENTNKLADRLNKLLTENNMTTPEFAELKRRFGWEFNGMRLHEYYFESMTKNQTELDKKSPLYQKISSDFGSFEIWMADFKATAAMRGFGWTILYFDENAGKLINVWVNEHDHGHLAGLKLILNLDVFEHAFMIDYGTKRADYVAAFLNAIDWDVVQERFA